MLKSLELSQKIAQRHWSVYKKDLLANLLPTVSDPIFFILTFGLGLGTYIQKIDEVNYINYVAPGLVVSAALYTSFFEMSYNTFIRYKYEKIYQAILTTPISSFEIALGEYIWVITKGCILSLIVSFIFYFIKIIPLKLLLAAPFLGALTAISCGSLAFISSSILTNINQFQTIFALIVNPLFFFSGIFFPVDDMPNWLNFFLQASPVYHCVQISQSLSWKIINTEEILYHIFCILLFSGIFVPISFFLFKKKMINS
ncbi:MAG: hypothetical protein CMP11_08265 [Zetaproteobacteria bacterium]|nr:hypothetical protein [Pseudobdellovibrionaceae bacterium]|tara:strand:- start:1770 stop:2540 length:771 start_codon:yes stop_codon:yes gene_type:complete